jgi:hypothetical protein
MAHPVPRSIDTRGLAFKTADRIELQCAMSATPVSVILRVDADYCRKAKTGIRRSHMRTLMFLQFPIEPFNTLTRNGSAGTKMKAILDDIKPESAYFTAMEGHRGGVLVVDVKNPSDIPALAEPWFLTFNAEVEFRIAMTPEDLGRANLDALGKKWA